MSGPVDLGQTYRYRHTVTDASGALANAGTVVVTITLPDGSTATPAVVNSGTGLYDIAYTTTQSGKHDLSGSVTGGVLGTEVDVWEDAFTVEQPLRMFIGVDEALAHLRANGLITTVPDREQLRWFCLAACGAVERDLGRVIARRTVTDVFNGGKPNVILRSSPIISVTSVTESGTVLASDDYTVDVSSGVLYRGSMWAQTTAQRGFIFLWGRQNVTVVYVAGVTNPPLIARKVALNTIQGMWQSRQLMPTPGIPEVVPGSMYIGTAALTAPELGAYNALRHAGIA